MISASRRDFEGALRLTPELRASRRRQIGQTVVAVMLAAADLSIIVAWTRDLLTASAMCGLHAALCLVLIGGHGAVQRARSAEIASDVLTAVLLGPFGAIGLLAMPSTEGVRRRAVAAAADPAPETAGTARDAEALYAAIRQGRRIGMAARPVTPLAEVFERGDGAEKNAALRAISRRYTPDMLPGLLRALNSETPSVRVQAAAVYSKLRGTYGARARALLGARLEFSDVADAEARIAACREVAGSGFVDAATQEMLGALVTALTARARISQLRGQRSALVERLVSGVSAPSEPAAHPLTAPPRLKRHACGGLG